MLKDVACYELSDFSDELTASIIVLTESSQIITALIPNILLNSLMTEAESIFETLNFAPNCRYRLSEFLSIKATLKASSL
jgi:hypothetical protein